MQTCVTTLTHVCVFSPSAADSSCLHAAARGMIDDRETHDDHRQPANVCCENAACDGSICCDFLEEEVHLRMVFIAAHHISTFFTYFYELQQPSGSLRGTLPHSYSLRALRNPQPKHRLSPSKRWHNGKLESCASLLPLAGLSIVRFHCSRICL